MENTGTSRMTREVYPVPDDVRSALQEHGVVADYRARPPYQQNDYIGWILRAKKESTRRKRIEQMVRELKDGTLYMKMAWKAHENS